MNHFSLNLTVRACLKIVNTAIDIKIETIPKCILRSAQDQIVSFQKSNTIDRVTHGHGACHRHRKNSKNVLKLAFKICLLLFVQHIFIILLIIHNNAIYRKI